MIDDMAVYIANLGKYNEGYLVGAWFRSEELGSRSPLTRKM